MRLTRALLPLLLFALVLAGRAVPVSVLATGDMHGWLDPQADIAPGPISKSTIIGVMP